jgi:hypothetical protein
VAEPIEIPQGGQTSIQKATGPRSRGGKERSSRNGIKHGIFSEVVVLPGESRDRYQLLLKELQEELQPDGRLEELLVEKLAVLAWRHRRLLIAEGAEIRASTEFRKWDEEACERNKAQAIDERLLGESRGLMSEIEDPEVFEHCLELLATFRQQIENDGFSKQRDIAILNEIYGTPDEEEDEEEYEEEIAGTFHDVYLTWQRTAAIAEGERRRTGCATPDQCRGRVLYAIECEVKRLESIRRCRELSKSIQSRRTELEIQKGSVPETKELERLLRCEASLERAFDRALNQLDRIQRQRRGQPATPRIEIDVSS